MHNLSLRFTGTSPRASDPYDTQMEVLELTFGATRLNVPLMPSRISYDPTHYRASMETVAERNSRLRHAAGELGHTLTQGVLAKLREMGHAV